MQTINTLFGTGTDLSILQMSLRAIVVFILGLSIIRLSGRRSFGVKMPFDNVIVILLGAILGRAVVGASPFIPTICASLVIVLLHRLFAIIAMYSHGFGKLIKGEERVLYKNGQLHDQHMRSGLISKRDLIEGMHLNGNIDTLDDAESIFLERNGEISVVKKHNKG